MRQTLTQPSRLLVYCLIGSKNLPKYLSLEINYQSLHIMITFPSLYLKGQLVCYQFNFHPLLFIITMSIVVVYTILIIIVLLSVVACIVLLNWAVIGLTPFLQLTNHCLSPLSKASHTTVRRAPAKEGGAPNTATVCRLPRSLALTSTALSNSCSL